jgi:hypothetical protein
MLEKSKAVTLTPQRRAAFVRLSIVRYLTDLNQLLLKGQSYDEPAPTSHSDDKLAALVSFGLKHASSPLRNLTPLQAKLITKDATGRYSRDLRLSSTWSDNEVQSRRTRRVTSAMIRKDAGLGKTAYEREMLAARNQVMVNMGLA